MMGGIGGGEFYLSPDETSRFAAEFRSLPVIAGKVNADTARTRVVKLRIRAYPGTV